MKFHNLLFFVVLLSCTKCSNKQEEPNNSTPNDTALTSLRPKYLPDPTNTLDPKIQKLELQYVVWGCACANWVTPTDYVKYQDSGLVDNCIFIEPADTTELFPDSLFVFDKNNIVVTGQFYNRKDYPKGTYETEEKLEKAKVFRYTKLLVVPKSDK